MSYIKTLAFNSGRGYTDKGQRIGAGLRADGIIELFDIDRNIEYVIKPCNITDLEMDMFYIENYKFNPAAILKEYDYADKVIGYRISDENNRGFLQGIAQNMPIPRYPVTY